MADISFEDRVRQSFMSGNADLRDEGIESEAFQQALAKVAEDGSMSQQEGYDLAHAYNRGITDANNADDDATNDAPLLSQQDFDDVAERGTQAKGYAERARERLEDLLDKP